MQLAVSVANHCDAAVSRHCHMHHIRLLIQLNLHCHQLSTQRSSGDSFSDSFCTRIVLIRMQCCMLRATEKARVTQSYVRYCCLPDFEDPSNIRFVEWYFLLKCVHHLHNIFKACSELMSTCTQDSSGAGGARTQRKLRISSWMSRLGRQWRKLTADRWCEGRTGAIVRRDAVDGFHSSHCRSSQEIVNQRLPNIELLCRPLLLPVLLQSLPTHRDEMNGLVLVVRSGGRSALEIRTVAHLEGLLRYVLLVIEFSILPSPVLLDLHQQAAGFGGE